MIGTTRSRVSFFMNKFRKLGFIDYSGGLSGRLEVHSSLLNMVLREFPASQRFPPAVDRRSLTRTIVASLPRDLPVDNSALGRSEHRYRAHATT